MLFIGTDEAGYGPLLGPLCIAAAAYEGAGPRSRLSGKGVDDSKVVYTRGGRDALAEVLKPYFDLPGPLRLSELLARYSVRGDPRPPYKWYGEVSDEVPAAGRRPETFRRLYLNPVCERDYNLGCRDGGKGGLLFRETMRVVRAALDDAPGVDAEVVCDKHGGRNRYAGLLMAEFVPTTLIPERESRAASSYRMTLPDRSVTIRFLKQADGRDKPAALASMAAKYLRELFMEGLNAFFAGRVEGLRPTAGYYGDGARFLGEIEDVLDDLGVARDDFVRAS